MTIFDRSWYGRVLVERVENLATEVQWRRAYDEIADFEHSLAEEGMVVIKLWMHMSHEEQLRRFERRRDDPLKSWKLTDEDWRNREKRGEYDEAVDDMLRLTARPDGPVGRDLRRRTSAIGRVRGDRDRDPAHGGGHGTLGRTGAARRRSGGEDRARSRASTTPSSNTAPSSSTAPSSDADRESGPPDAVAAATRPTTVPATSERLRTHLAARPRGGRGARPGKAGRMSPDTGPRPHRPGITIPLEGDSPPRPSRWFARLRALGYTDLWSAEVDGADGFTPLALAAAWEPDAQPGRGHHARLHPGARPAGPERGRDGRCRSGPLRLRPGRLLRGHRGRTGTALLSRTSTAGSATRLRFLRLAFSGEKVTEDLRDLPGQGLPPRPAFPNSSRPSTWPRCAPGCCTWPGGRPTAPSSTGSAPTTWPTRWRRSEAAGGQGDRGPDLRRPHRRRRRWPGPWDGG